MNKWPIKGVADFFVIKICRKFFFSKRGVLHFVKRLYVCAQNAGYLSHPSKKINYQLKACFSWLL